MANIEDIARISKFSKGTVSKVINNYPGVSEKTREKILQVIKDNHFVPNIQAQKLAGIKDKVMGVFIFDENGIYGSSYFQDLVSLLTEEAEEKELKVLVAIARNSQQKWKIKSLLDNNTIQCAVVIGATLHEPELEMIIEENYKVITFDYQPHKHSTSCFVVGSNNYNGGALAAKYLFQAGAQNIIHLAGDFNKLAGIQRKNGFVETLQSRGIIPKILKGNFTIQQAKRLFQLEIVNEELPDAVFCANDEMAIGCLEALKEHKIDEKKIRILGFDNTIISRLYNPRISSISYNKREMVQNAIQAADNLITDKPLPKFSFNGELTLHIRET